MPALYLTEQGSSLHHQERRLFVIKDGIEIASVPLAQVDEVIVYGNVAITTPTLKLLLFEGIDLILLQADGDYCGRLVGPLSKNGRLRRMQYASANVESFALQVARACITGKLSNMRTLLLRYNRDLNRPDIAEAAERIEAATDAVSLADNHASLMGYEGTASAEYFGVFAALFKRPWTFIKRDRRPPPDPVNVLLSLAYTLLSKDVGNAIQAVGLDPYVGFLHEISYGRTSLALDLMEEFRPLLADSVVLRCLNTEVIKPEDFTPGEDATRPVVLSQAGFKRFIGEYEARMATEITHPVSAEKVVYQRCLELQARRLVAAIMNNGEYGAFTVR